MLVLFGLFVSLGVGRVLFELVVQPHSHQTDGSGQDEDENGGGKIAGNQRSTCQRGAEDGGQTCNGRDGKKAQRTDVDKACCPGQQILWSAGDKKQQEGDALKSLLVL